MNRGAYTIIAGVGAGTVSPPSSIVRENSEQLTHYQGGAVARRFAKAYPVVLLARNPSNYEDVAREINASGGQAMGISTDMSKRDSVNAAAQKIRDEFGNRPLAAAIFNLGGGFVRRPFLELTEDEFARGFQVQGYVSSELKRP